MHVSHIKISVTFYFGACVLCGVVSSPNDEPKGFIVATAESTIEGVEIEGKKCVSLLNAFPFKLCLFFWDVFAYVAVTTSEQTSPFCLFVLFAVGTPFGSRV